MTASTALFIFSNIFRKEGFPVGNYMFEVNNRNTRARCEIYSKLTVKTLERHHRSSVYIVNSEQVNITWVWDALLSALKEMTLGHLKSVKKPTREQTLNNTGNKLGQSDLLVFNFDGIDKTTRKLVIKNENVLRIIVTFFHPREHHLRQPKQRIIFKGKWGDAIGDQYCRLWISVLCCENVSLHDFCDAPGKAYGAVVYVKVVWSRCKGEVVGG